MRGNGIEKGLERLRILREFSEKPVDFDTSAKFVSDFDDEPTQPYIKLPGNVDEETKP